jgi:DNA-binding NtrC family response regulator
MPPLRERREDIPLLIRHWLLRRAQKYAEAVSRFLRVGAAGAMEPRISGRLVDYLVRQPLPLNVRQLNALLVKALDASPDGEVKLPSSMPSFTTSPPPEPSEEEGETQDRGDADPPSKEKILATLAREGGKVSRAAKSLGLHRNVVYRLMREYGIKRTPPDNRNILGLFATVLESKPPEHGDATRIEFGDASFDPHNPFVKHA